MNPGTGGGVRRESTGLKSSADRGSLFETEDGVSRNRGPFSVLKGLPLSAPGFQSGASGGTGFIPHLPLMPGVLPGKSLRLEQARYAGRAVA